MRGLVRLLNNPFGPLLLFLACALPLALGSVLITIYEPGWVGLVPQPEVEIKRAYKVHQLILNRKYLKVEIGNGLLVSGYSLGDITAVVILGDGRYTFTVPERYQKRLGKTISDHFEQAYLLIPFPPAELAAMAEEAKEIQSAEIDEADLRRAKRSFEETGERFGHATVFGVKRLAKPPSGSFLIHFSDRRCFVE